MAIDFEVLFSKNALRMKRSEIRELLKLTRQPGMISFAGGLPAPEVFPVEEIKEVTDYVLKNEARTALQYGPTEGDPNLKKEIIKLTKKEGIEAKAENILITTASQQALDLIAKIFLDRKDTVIMEEPTYVGGIQAFNSYGAKMETVRCDDEGMIPEALEEKIKALKQKNIHPKFIYIVPDFQNPSGITTTERRRKKILEIAEKYSLLIVEDTPYRQLRYEGKNEPPFQALDNSGRVISLFTFSKIFIPGFRLGWIVADEKVIEKLVIAKQAVDLCTSPFNQAITYEFLRRGYLEKTLTRIVDLYRRKRDHMLKMLDKYMPVDRVKGLRWTRPAGGLFLWVELPTYMDSGELIHRAIEEKVAYVVGSAFHPYGKTTNAFRLNFSYPSFEEIEEGVKRLAKVILKYQEEIEGKETPTTIAP